MAKNKCRILIRTMRETDIEQVYAIETQSITPPWSRQGFTDALANENAHFYVAEICGETGAASEGEVAGYCGLYLAADEAEITNVAVAPGRRGNGIADRILAVVRADAKMRKVSQIFLEVRESNLPARKLYEKHGFVSVGLRKNFYREPKEHAVVMMCSLEQDAME